MAEKTNTQAVTVKTQVSDQVIARINNLQENGFVIPKDYSFVNAIKASLMIIEDLKDKNKQPALSVCTHNSIAKALFKMAVKGIDASKNQCYFIVRGNELTLQESYFGKVLQVKRIFPDFDPIPRVVYDGDDFVYETDVETGRKKLVRHIQTLANLDKDFVGAYMYIPTKDGGQDLYIMTKKMILAAWSKSSNTSQSTHKQFTDKMVGKTIINSACNMIINSTPELNQTHEDIPQNEINEPQEPTEDATPIEEFAESTEFEEVGNDTPPITTPNVQEEAEKTTTDQKDLF